MSGHDIFISYSRKERPMARLYAESLAEEGFSVWWDAVLHSGETFDEVIERELRAARAVVVLWSPLSVASRWVRAEATQADRGNKLVPVMIEACERPIIFELTHAAELMGWSGDREDSQWRTLINDLRRLIGPARSEPAAKESAPAPVEEQPPAEIAEVAPKAAEPVEKVEPVATKKRPSQAEIIEALDRLAKPAIAPTAAEEAQAKFFKQSDEYRQNEGERVHCLRRIHADGAELYHVVGTTGLKIGRKAPADIIVSEPGVSREHCVIELAADKLRVSDLNSTNGTFIDDKRIERAEILPVGAVLRVGNVSFEHEVRSRAEIQQSHALSFDREGMPREQRIA